MPVQTRADSAKTPVKGSSAAIRQRSTVKSNVPEEQQTAAAKVDAAPDAPAAERSAARNSHRDDSRSLSQEAAFVLHALALLAYVRVWMWHLTPAASLLPGATGFGWFFRYLTFYSYTLQAIALFVACLADLAQDPPKRIFLEDLADDLSCALFGIANAVTALFYIINAVTGDQALVEGGNIARPVWLGASVHLFNSIVAWADTLVGHPRSFSRRAERISVVLIAFYMLWILACSHFNGAFPYPFLNQLPWPQGFICMAIVSVALFFGLFRLGKWLCVHQLRKRLKQQ